jgi:hypothetical protein
VPRLSIVIPCLGGAAEFDGTLVSVLQQRPADCEVLVVHTAAYDDPYDLAGEVRFLQRPAQRQVVELINEGLAAAAGEIVHVLGCGLEASEGWTQPALQHFDDPDVAAVSPLVLHGDSQIAAAGVRYSLGGTRRVVADRRLLSPGTGRLRAGILGPTLAAGFYRRNVLAALDGFDVQMGDYLADVDLALSLKSLGRLHVCEPASRLVQAANVNAHGAHCGFNSGRAAQRMFRRHAGGQSAAALALYPFSLAGDLVRQGLGFSAAVSLVGRVAAALELGQASQQQERIDRATQRLEELAELRATIRMPTSLPAAVSTAAQRRAA